VSPDQDPQAPRVAPPTPETTPSLDGSAWDAVIVGAGPAGSLAAHELSRRGCRVLLVERHALPRDKVCGGCLHPRGVALLEHLGLASVLEASQASPLHTLHLSCEGKTLALSPALGVAVSRSSLDLHLARAAEFAGATLVEGWTARLTPCADDARRRVVLSRGEAEIATVEAELVVAADGLASPVFAAAVPSDQAARASHLGAGALLAPEAVPDEQLLPGQVALTVGASGYVGRVRLPDGRVDLAAALTPDAVREGVAPAVAALLRTAGAPDCAQAAREAAWRTTPALTRQPRRLASSRVLAVGDAAGFVEPFTGEGMTWALEGGALLGELAADGWRDDLGARWDQALRTRLAASRRRCARVATLLRRPRLLGAALFLLARAPGLASRVVRAGHGTVSP
jgi:flavin-dependent dehydrogenase